MSFSGKKYIWKFKKKFATLLPCIVSEGVTGINGKEQELSFHPHFILGGFTPL